MSSTRVMVALAWMALASGVLGAAPFVLQGCGSDDDDDGSSAHDGGSTDASLAPLADGGPTGAEASLTSGDGGVTLAKACNDLAYARCQAVASCSGNSLTAQRWGTVAECEVRLGQQCLLDLAATGTGATPDTTEACAQALPNADCTDVVADILPEVCAPVAGSLATGAHCFTSAQCQSSFCDLGASSECGVCAPLPEAGAPCTAATDCGDPATFGCSNKDANGILHCVQFEEAGAPCQSGVTLCGPGIVCTTTVDPDSGATLDASCMVQGTEVGDPCSTQNIDVPGCNGTYGLVCGADGGCAAVDYVFEAGASCDGVNVRCGANGLCVNGGCVESVATEGAVCSTKTGPLCLPQARCITNGGPSGTCVSLGNDVCAQ